jgi:hypothetical protein
MITIFFLIFLSFPQDEAKFFTINGEATGTDEKIAQDNGRTVNGTGQSGNEDDFGWVFSSVTRLSTQRILGLCVTGSPRFYYYRKINLALELYDSKYSVARYIVKFFNINYF